MLIRFSTTLAALILLTVSAFAQNLSSDLKLMMKLFEGEFDNYG